MKREDWQKRRAAWARALYEAAHYMADGSPLRNILGSVAWGRYEGESQPGELKDHIAFGCGYLQGIRDAALGAGRECSLKGTEQLEGMYGQVRKYEAQR